MQPKGWGPTQASRIVIIFVVVQYLGLGQILAFAPAATAGCTDSGHSQGIATLEAAVPLAVLFDPRWRPTVALGELDHRATLPDTAPLPRQLPRAPPAA
jgi:hypothetical protein